MTVHTPFFALGGLILNNELPRFGIGSPSQATSGDAVLVPNNLPQSLRRMKKMALLSSPIGALETVFASRHGTDLLCEALLLKIMRSFSKGTGRKTPITSWKTSGLEVVEWNSAR